MINAVNRKESASSGLSAIIRSSDWVQADPLYTGVIYRRHLQVPSVGIGSHTPRADLRLNNVGTGFHLILHSDRKSPSIIRLDQACGLFDPRKIGPWVLQQEAWTIATHILINSHGLSAGITLECELWISAAFIHQSLWTQ
jgi:hypothetical protein